MNPVHETSSSQHSLAAFHQTPNAQSRGRSDHWAEQPNSHFTQPRSSPEVTLDSIPLSPISGSRSYSQQFVNTPTVDLKYMPLLKNSSPSSPRHSNSHQQHSTAHVHNLDHLNPPKLNFHYNNNPTTQTTMQYHHHHTHHNQPALPSSNLFLQSPVEPELTLTTQLSMASFQMMRDSISGSLPTTTTTNSQPIVAPLQLPQEDTVAPVYTAPQEDANAILLSGLSHLNLSEATKTSLKTSQEGRAFGSQSLQSSTQFTTTPTIDPSQQQQQHSSSAPTTTSQHNIQFASHASTSSAFNNASPHPIALVSDEEFVCMPSFLRSQVQCQALNEAIASLNSYVTRKNVTCITENEVRIDLQLGNTHFNYHFFFLFCYLFI